MKSFLRATLCAFLLVTHSTGPVTGGIAHLSSWCSLQTLSSGSPPAVQIHKVETPWTPAPSSWSTGSAGTPWTSLQIKEKSLLLLVFIKQTNKQTWKLKGNTHTPWIIARARMPPVLVPATQSKSSLVGRPASLSRAINIWINTKPLIPPPSRHRSLSILQRRREGYKEIHSTLSYFR